MTGSTTSVAIDIAAGDLADLEQWAQSSERSVQDLLQDALRAYLDDVRADIADLDARMAGPSFSLDEVKARVAARRRGQHIQAAE